LFSDPANVSNGVKRLSDLNLLNAFFVLLLHFLTFVRLIGRTGGLPMKFKTFGGVFVLVAVVGLASGCHDLRSRDSHRGYGSSSYREGYRDGRAYESRRDDWRNRRDTNWRRW
jgi:hypothetical protein